MAVILGYDTENPEQHEALLKHLAEEWKKGRPMRDVLEVPPHLLENVYLIAYQKYQAGEYEQAGDMFRYLLAFDDTCYKYVLGLAACLHRLKEYGPAARTYLMASLQNPQDPVPYYHGADCLIHEGDLEQALEALGLCIKFASLNEGKYGELKERALLIEKNISEQLKK